MGPEGPQGPQGPPGPCCTGPTGPEGTFNPNLTVPAIQLNPNSLYFVPHTGAAPDEDWGGKSFERSNIHPGAKHVFTTKKEFRLAYQDGTGPTGYLDCCNELTTGPTGPTGPAGQRGPQGIPGRDGEDGVSDKSCIVDTKNYGYRAFSCIEAPEVLFFDVISTNLKDTQFKEIEIDPIFIESCVENSIKVISSSCDHPCSVGAKIEKGNIKIRIIPIGSIPPEVEVNLMISGTRKDFKDHRLAKKTKDQYNMNENFWKTIGQKNFMTEN